MQDILVVTRRYRQVYITMWYPYTFGDESNEKSKHNYTTIVQEIVPTRTGLNGVKSSAAVWLSAVNFTEPQPPQVIYEKEWDDDELLLLKNQTDAMRKESLVRVTDDL